jgi:hypothetical protein
MVAGGLAAPKNSQPSTANRAYNFFRTNSSEENFFLPACNFSRFGERNFRTVGLLSAFLVRSAPAIVFSGPAQRSLIL